MLRKLILKLFVVVLPVIALFFVHMYMIVSFAEKLANNVVNGKTSYTIPNYNDRRVVRKIIEKQIPPSQTAVLGSSSGIQLSPEMTGFFDQMNHCLSGGEFPDWLGILGLYMDQDELPNRIILGVSPWHFLQGKDENGSANGFIFKDTFADFIGIKGLERLSCIYEKIEGTMRECLRIKPIFADEYKVYEHKEDARHPELMYAKYPTGCRGYSEKHDKYSTAAARLGYNTSSSISEHFNKDAIGYFKDIRKFCEDNGIELIIFLIAPSPAYIVGHDEFNKGILINDVENLVRDLSDGLLVRGTYSPYVLNLTNEDFHDNYHIKKEHLQQVWDYIK